MSQLPNTLTPSEYKLTPDTLGLITEIKPIWGRLYSTMINLPAHDLDKSTFKLGRTDSCDYILSKSTFPKKKLDNISREHFEIIKEPGEPIFIRDLSKNGTFLNGKLIGKRQKIILQNDDDISIGFQGLKVFVFKNLDSGISDFLPPNLQKKYELSKFLGKGACGEVRLVFDKWTCRPYAVKRIIKSRPSRVNDMNHITKIQKEIKILEDLQHPFIVQIEDVEDTEQEVFIVMEYLKGGTLCQLLESYQLTENQARHMFYQLVLALQYLHVKGIIHRDIKAENILLLSEDLNDPVVKISDFGLSKVLEDGSLADTVCGTPFYAAPEVVDRSVITYDRKVDIWSLGVLLYYMLANVLPFMSNNTYILNKKITNGQFSMKQPVWESISDEAKDLIYRMLTKEPELRINLEDIPDHPWIKSDLKMVQKVHDRIYTHSTTVQLDETLIGPPAKRARYSQDSD